MSSGPATALTSYKPLADENDTAKQKSITLDSLPYIDNLHPDYEAYALTLIEEEMQKMEQEKEKSPSSPSDDFVLLRHLPNPLGMTNSADTTPSSFVTKAEKTNYSLNK